MKNLFIVTFLIFNVYTLFSSQYPITHDNEAIDAIENELLSLVSNDQKLAAAVLLSVTYCNETEYDAQHLNCDKRVKTPEQVHRFEKLIFQFYDSLNHLEIKERQSRIDQMFKEIVFSAARPCIMIGSRLLMDYEG